MSKADVKRVRMTVDAISDLDSARGFLMISVHLQFLSLVCLGHKRHVLKEKRESKVMMAPKVTPKGHPSAIETSIWDQ